MCLVPYTKLSFGNTIINKIEEKLVHIKFGEVYKQESTIEK